MPAPGRHKGQQHHEFAQQLDLVRRMHGLSTAQLAAGLYCSDRTIRRYLSAERLPPRDTVVRWEQICAAPPGTLTAPFDELTSGRPPSAELAGETKRVLP